MGIFNRQCSVCLEKDARIKDLLSEVAYLRELASPAKLTVQIPAVHAEADKIMSSTENQELIHEELEQAQLIDAEAAQLLSGTY